ncbi:MAG: GntR family transcriptional regulator [Candidatus Fimivivens sp.]
MKSVAIKQTKDKIADMIRSDILSGVLKSGDELIQEQVAEQTGLSRMPVREAFQTLEQEGLLLRLPNRHMRVIEIMDINIRQYFTTLVALEQSFFGQLIAAKSKTDNIVSALEKAIDGNALHDEFDSHIAPASALDNEYLLGIHVKMLSSFYLYTLRHFWKPSCTNESLRTILNGVKKADENMIGEGLRSYFAYYEKCMLKGKVL